MNTPRFSHIAAFCHTQVKPQAAPWVSFLVPSLQSVCSEKTHCLPYTTKSSMAELTVTTLKSQPNSCSSLQQINGPCWCSLQAEHSYSLLNNFCPLFITWIFISNPNWDSREHELPFPIQLNLPRWDTYLQEAFSIFSMACLQLLWTRAVEEPCRIRSFLVGFARGYQCFTTALQK